MSENLYEGSERGVHSFNAEGLELGIPRTQLLVETPGFFNEQKSRLKSGDYLFIRYQEHPFVAFQYTIFIQGEDVKLFRNPFRQ